MIFTAMRTMRTKMWSASSSVPAPATQAASRRGSLAPLAPLAVAVIFHYAQVAVLDFGRRAFSRAPRTAPSLYRTAGLAGTVKHQVGAMASVHDKCYSPLLIAAGPDLEELQKMFNRHATLGSLTLAGFQKCLTVCRTGVF